jgi:tetratricopeptide (TPR) repeat protein
LEASTTPAEIRQSTLLALADAHLNRWFVTSRDSADAAAEEGRQVALREARDRFQQLQREFPAFSAAQVTFNYGICLQQLGEHAAAIQQFEKISWPADPQADLAATAVAWQAQFNLARSHFLLGNAPAARQAIDLSLQHLSHATETTGGRAVLLRMRMAQQEEDWATVSALARDGAAWLKSAPDQAPEIEFLQALAQFRSTDAAEKLWGANRLTELAQIAQHPFANQAKFCLIPWQLESATPSPHRAARVDLDRKIIADLRPRIVAAAQAATDLLASADLNVDDLPVNATLWLPAQRDRYERRKQVQMWQADALFKLQDHSRAEAAYAKLRGAYADDPAAPMWAIKQAISLAQSPAPQDSGSSIPAPANLTAALDLLSEAVLATWPKEPQADGWFIRGELLRLKADPAAAVLAYQRAADSFAQPADQIMALGEVVQIWQTEEKHAEIVQLADRWMPSLSGSGQAFMSLQRGIAHHHLKNPAAAEADFARVQEIASSTPSADEDDHKRVQELLADAVFNRGLMLQQLQRASAAKDLWESFLADQRHGETRRLLDERLSELLPKWRESEVGTEQIAETSGSQKMASLSIDELLTLAEQQFQQQQWPAAIQTLEQLNQQAQEDDRHDKVLYLWGWALREQKLLAEARSAWEKLIELHIASPWIARAQFHLGELAYQAGNYPVAANHFQSSRTVSAEPQVQRNSLYMEAWSDLNRDLFEAAGNKFQMVIDSATETDREHPLVWESHALVGQCHYRAQQWNLALQSFQSATPQLEKLQSHKPDLYFMSCFNAGRAALALEQPGQAIGWLTRCSLMDPTALSELADAADLIAEAKLLLAATLRMTNDPAGAQSQLLELTPRSDRFGLRALVEMAEVAKSQGDESNVRRSFQAAANGAFGPNLSPRDIDLKARALLEVGLSFLRTAQQQTDTAVAAEHLRQAKTWLARAQIQTDSATVSQEAQQQLQRLGTTR